MGSNVEAVLFYGIPIAANRQDGVLQMREDDPKIMYSELSEEEESISSILDYDKEFKGLADFHISGYAPDDLLCDVFLSVKESVQKTPHTITEIDVSKMVVQEGWDDIIKRVCEKHNLVWMQPRWILIASYG